MKKIIFENLFFFFSFDINLFIYLYPIYIKDFFSSFRQFGNHKNETAR